MARRSYGFVRRGRARRLPSARGGDSPSPSPPTSASASSSLWKTARRACCATAALPPQVPERVSRRSDGRSDGVRSPPLPDRRGPLEWGAWWTSGLGRVGHSCDGDVGPRVSEDSRLSAVSRLPGVSMLPGVRPRGVGRRRSLASGAGELARGDARTSSSSPLSSSSRSCWKPPRLP